MISREAPFSNKVISDDIEIKKEFSKDLKAATIRNREKHWVTATMSNGVTYITGSIFVPKDVRASDFLRNEKTKRLLLVDAFINGVEQLSPILLIVDNCMYISLVSGDYESSVQISPEFE